MRKSLEEYAKEYNAREGYGLDNEDLYETFVESLSEGVVQQEFHDSRRWYDVHELVHKVTIDQEERFFQTYEYHTTGDACASDMGLEPFTLNDVVEVYPETITKTIYR